MNMHEYGFGGGWMMGWGVGHWVVMAAMAAAVLYPIGVILRGLGYSPFWAVLTFVPIINIIALWIVAFSGAAEEFREKRT